MTVVLADTKVCTKCGEEKTPDDFYDHPGGREGKNSACKPCLREDSRKARLGLKRKPLWKTCPICFRGFAPSYQRGRPPVTCSDECREERKKQIYLAWYESYTPTSSYVPVPKQNIECPVCGTVFLGTYPRIYCRSQCRWRATTLKHKYGLPADWLRVQHKRQGGLCAACLEPMEDAIPRIDHDHETGKVRGLLHENCNIGLGHAHDDPEKLRRWANYLEEHR